MWMGSPWEKQQMGVGGRKRRSSDDDDTEKQLVGFFGEVGHETTFGVGGSRKEGSTADVNASQTIPPSPAARPHFFFLFSLYRSRREGDCVLGPSSLSLRQEKKRKKDGGKIVLRLWRRKEEDRGRKWKEWKKMILFLITLHPSPTAKAGEKDALFPLSPFTFLKGRERRRGKIACGACQAKGRKERGDSPRPREEGEHQ